MIELSINLNYNSEIVKVLKVEKLLQHCNRKLMSPFLFPDRFVWLYAADAGYSILQRCILTYTSELPRNLKHYLILLLMNVYLEDICNLSFLVKYHELDFLRDKSN